MKKNKAVFLDRDGVINEIVVHAELGTIDSPSKASEFVLKKGIAELIRKIRNAGYKIIVVTNQPGLAKKKYTVKIFNEIDRKMKELLQAEKAEIDAIYYCLHHPEAKDKKYKKICDCRKPEPGLLLSAKKDFSIDMKKSYIIGDSWSDIAAGKKAGCKTILFSNFKCDLCNLLREKNILPDTIAGDFKKIEKIICP